MKMQALLCGALLTASMQANATMETIRVSMQLTTNGKQSPATVSMMQVGATMTTRIGGTIERPEMNVRVSPVVGNDQSIVLETEISINKTVAGAPHLFDKQVANLKVRSKLGETASVEMAPGERMEWTAELGR
ncbi:MAG: hypothetical protein ING73_10295 [Rhodocyclaceae bacterium]|nr:hypothetical protein [Rhodocyclaceae bacterium]MCA3017816.1 hypothetical protein [Rhodocyclaceae bacterium]MCA3024871.1 hypothetical protein [Rhodocyclaceae bacterium]MCA3032180.1 hypothetical protein [Rhodocyclaceae bacterium]MCA3035882.1 hypothetical protein [Rhodocyclaceae bacterium]